MKVFCPISGIAYTTTYGIGNFTQAHPTLTIPIHELKQFAMGQLVYRGKNKDKKEWQVNTYLLLLSWFMKLPGIQVNSTINMDDCLHVLVANQEQLMKTVIAVDTTKHKIDFPGITVSKENNLQEQLVNWLDTYNECIRISNIAIHETKRIRTARELDEALDSITNIFLPHSAKKHAKLVADWAVVAGNFPHSVSSLWYDIIINLFRDDEKKLADLAVTQADIDELIEHCEDNIPHGSYHAHELMAKLRETMSIISRATNQSSTTDVRAELLESDEEEPIEEDYETRVDYLKAKANWMASRLRVQKVTKGGIVSDLEL